MGVVLKQSVKNLVITYLGFSIGAVNVLLLYPHFIEKEYYGIINTLLASGTLLSGLIGWGMSSTLIKFYTSYSDRRHQEGLLGLALITPLISGLAFGILGIIFYGFIQDYFGNNQNMEPFIWMILVIAVCTAYFKVFFNCGKLKLKSVFGSFMREVFHRALISLLLLLVFSRTITTIDFIYCLAGVYVLRTLIMMGYAFYLLPPKRRFKLPYDFYRILYYYVLILVVGFAANVLLDLDKVMIPHFMPFGNVAVYAIAVYI